jgi:hypothetical protein
MNKDNFYYILRDRLEYAEDYLIDTSAFIKSVKFQDKVEKEFFKDKILLYLLVGLINIPSDVIKYYQYLVSVLNYKRAQNEIKILRIELSKYEQQGLIE